MISLKNILLLPPLVITMLLSSCLATDDPTCGSEQSFGNQELVLAEENGIQYVSSSTSLESRIDLCRPTTAPDSVGFDDIYVIQGIVVDNCSDGGCIDITDFNNPFCVISIPQVEADFTLFESWKLGYLVVDERQIHPSCLFPENDVFIATNADSTVNQILGEFGLNGVLVEFDARGDDSFEILSVTVESSLGPPYIQFFETTIIELLEDTEIVEFAIENNILTLFMKDGAEIVLFRTAA